MMLKLELGWMAYFLGEIINVLNLLKQVLVKGETLKVKARELAENKEVDLVIMD